MPKQATVTTRITYMALSLLLITTAFKLLHLPGTTLVLFTSIGAFTLALSTGAITGIKRNKDKLGSGLLLAVIGSVILHIIAWVLILLQLPGATPTSMISLVALILTFSTAFYQLATTDNYANNILSFLHDKYSPGIERVLLIILGVAGLLKISALIMGYPPNVGMVLLVFVISGGVLHYFASQWQMTLSRDMVFLLIGTFIIGELPAFGPLIPYETRAALVTLFYILIGSISWTQSNTSYVQKSGILLTIVFYVLFLLYSWNLLGNNMERFLFNPLNLLVLISFLAFCWNIRLLKVFYITVIAHYLLEYPIALGFTF